MDSLWVAAIWAVTPTIVVGAIFWFVLRAILRADRSERAAYAKIEAQERARMTAGEGTGPRP